MFFISIFTNFVDSWTKCIYTIKNYDIINLQESRRGRSNRGDLDRAVSGPAATDLMVVDSRRSTRHGIYTAIDHQDSATTTI